MFNTKRFGAYISKLRKDQDMTQSELGEILNVTRQAISKYEVGDSFPDISILILMAEIFDITLDELIRAGDPTKTEANLLCDIVYGHEEAIPSDVTDLINLAPLLKPSILSKLSSQLEKDGIDINHIVTLAEYLNDESVLNLLKNATFDTMNEDLLSKLIPFLDETSKMVLFEKILEGELDYHMISVLIPYAESTVSLIEAAVVEGVLPWEALDIMHEGLIELYRKKGI
jgi:transcriptional regulator with XRE-family HTH domain